MRSILSHGAGSGFRFIMTVISVFTIIMSLAGCGSSGGSGDKDYYRMTSFLTDSESSAFVNSTFRVSDKSRKGVTGLQKEDFEIYEGASIVVSPGSSDLVLCSRDSLQNIPGYTYSLVTVILIDNSQSQAAYLEIMKESAKVFVDSIDDKKQQKIAVISFDSNGNPLIVQQPTNKQAEVHTAINSINVTIESVDLYGGMLQGLSLWDHDASPKGKSLQQGFLVVMTDGYDTLAKYSLDEVIAERDEIGAYCTEPKKVFAVIVGPTTPPVDIQKLANVESAPDNGYYLVPDPAGKKSKNQSENLIMTMDSIQDVMIDYADSFYWIRYKSSMLANTGDANLAISIKDNRNKEADAVIANHFSTASFYNGRYNRLFGRYVDAAYPWNVNATFNAFDFERNGVIDLSVDDIIAVEKMANGTTRTINKAGQELALHNRNDLREDELSSGYTYSLNTVLIFDNSPSNAKNLQAFKDAAKAFIDKMDEEQQRIAIIAYIWDKNQGVLGQPDIVQPLTDDKTALKQIVDDIKEAKSLTDLYGAQLFAMDNNSWAEPLWEDATSLEDSDFVQNFLISITDGNDTFSGNKAEQVKARRDELNNLDPGNCQIVTVALGKEAQTNQGLAEISKSAIYSDYGDDGLFIVPDLFAYDHGVQTNQVKKTLLEIQEGIQNFADCFYWMTYRTGLSSTDIGNHTLEISIKENQNPETDALMAATFTAADLFDGDPGVYFINPNTGLVDELGNWSVPLSPGESDKTITVTAATYLGTNTSYSQYRWTVTGGTSVEIDPASVNSKTAIFKVKTPGDTTIQIIDLINNLPPVTLIISVKVDTTPTYSMKKFNLEGRFPYYVNALFQVGDGADGWRQGLTSDYFSVWEDIDGDGTYNDIDEPVQYGPQSIQVLQHNNIEYLTDDYNYRFRTILFIDNTTLPANMDVMKNAAKQFIDAALQTTSPSAIKNNSGNIQQEIAIVCFDPNTRRPEVVKPFSNDPVSLKAFIDDEDNIFAVINGVDLYGAIIDIMNDPQLFKDDYSLLDNNSIEQTVLVVMTSGYNSDPSAKSLEALTAARDIAGVAPKTILAVGIGDDILSPVNPELKDIDNFGGTGFYPVPNPTEAVSGSVTALDKEMVKVQGKLLEYVKGFYWLRYRSDMTNDPLLTHKVKIIVKNNESDLHIDEPFNTGDFGAAGAIYINDAVRPGGVVVKKDDGTYKMEDSLFLFNNLPTTYRLEASTFKPEYGAGDEGAYVWTATPASVLLKTEYPDSSIIDLRLVGVGTATITVVNTTAVNAIPLEFTIKVENRTSVLYYPFNSNADDESGNNRDGVVLLNPALVADHANNPNSRAYAFNGTNQFIALHAFYGQVDNGSDDYISNATNDLTVCAWIKTASANENMRIISFGYNFWDLSLQGGHVVLIGTQSGISRVVRTTDTYNDNKWHFISGVIHQSGEMTIYVDGQSVLTQETFPPTNTTSDRYGFIGVMSNTASFNSLKVPGTFFSGTIDDVMVFDSILSEGEIKMLMGMVP